MLVVFPKDVSKAHSGEWGVEGAVSKGEKFYPQQEHHPAPLPLFNAQCPKNEVTAKKY
ncbi:hypothetical protein KBT16_10385 [Nostoc sp. CCCryo 231-06]|nr:hypothetical protein [Nostoc sp. CCCryo 231-06]